MGDYEHIKVRRDGGVETIALSRPDRNNVIGSTMIGELLWALEEARAKDEVRVIVLTGEGKSFCAGADFSHMTERSDAPWLGEYANLLLALARADKPVVARVNGNALGGGLGLVAASSFAIASTNAKLGTPEVEVGLFPIVISAMLSRVMSRRRLLEMMLLGQKLSAEEAARVGLVNRYVAPESLDAEVQAVTSAIVGKSAMAIRLGLRAFAAQEDLELERALPMLAARFAECLATDDALEGMTAFLEKRTPRWTGR